MSVSRTGDHVIEVLYLNKPITGSPFHCQVFDWGKINVSKLPHNTITDRLIDFDSKHIFTLITELVKMHNKKRFNKYKNKHC